MLNVYLKNNVNNFVISDGISKLLKSPGICFEESIPPAYVAWQAGTATLFPLGT
jgi:hypothetical protein